MSFVIVFGATAIGTSLLWYFFIVRSFKMEVYQGGGRGGVIREDKFMNEPDREVLVGKTYTLALFRSRGSRVEVIDMKKSDGVTFVFFRNVMTREEKILSEYEFKRMYSMWKERETSCLC